MMFSAGGSCFNFHFPNRAFCFSFCADTSAVHATTMRTATIVPARCIRTGRLQKKEVYCAHRRALMRQIPLLLLALVLGAPSRALATWSVIAVDRSTGRVVIASATCVDRDDEFLKGVQAVVVPGQGGAAGQPGVGHPHAHPRAAC